MIYNISNYFAMSRNCCTFALRIKEVTATPHQVAIKTNTNMKFNVYYQSYTLCELKAGLTDYFTIIKDEEKDVLSLAKYFAQILFDNLSERIACVVCDEDDMVIHYFQATHEGIIGPVDAEHYFAGGKATMENGRFYIEK